MADMHTLQMRIMFQCYEQQLLAARRLARFRVKRRLAEGLKPQDPDPSVNRRVFVEKVARELYDTLIFTGSSNPVVEEIRAELSEAVGLEVEFTYPPGARLRIVASGPDGQRPLSAEEERRARHALWRITRQKVDQSMLERPERREAAF